MKVKTIIEYITNHGTKGRFVLENYDVLPQKILNGLKRKIFNSKKIRYYTITETIEQENQA